MGLVLKVKVGVRVEVEARVRIRVMAGIRVRHRAGFRSIRVLKRTEVDAEGHRAQREQRGDQAPRELAGGQLAPEARAVVLQHAVHVPDERLHVHRLETTRVGSRI